MPKHAHLQTMTEQIGDKGYASTPFHYDRKSPRVHKPLDEVSIQLKAYQIHQEKGGSALENWLEAERILRNNDQVAGC